MELGDFLEQDILRFLDETSDRLRQQHESARPAREDEYELFSLQRDYAKELLAALDEDSLGKAKRVFDDLKTKYNQIPRSSMHKKQVYLILEELYARIKEYIERKNRERSLSDEILDPKIAQVFESRNENLVEKIEESDAGIAKEQSASAGAPSMPGGSAMPAAPMATSLPVAAPLSSLANLAGERGVRGGPTESAGGEKVLEDELYGLLKDVREVKDAIEHRDHPSRPLFSAAMNADRVREMREHEREREGAPSMPGGSETIDRSYGMGQRPDGNQSPSAHSPSSFIIAPTREGARIRSMARASYPQAAYPQAAYPQEPSPEMGGLGPSDSITAMDRTIEGVQGELSEMHQQLESMRQGAQRRSRGQDAATPSLQEALSLAEHKIGQEMLSVKQVGRLQAERDQLRQKILEQREISSQIAREQRELLLIRSKVSETLMRINAHLAAGQYAHAQEETDALRTRVRLFPLQVRRDVQDSLRTLADRISSLILLSQGKRMSGALPPEEELYRNGLMALLQDDPVRARESFIKVLAVNPNHLASRIRLAEAERKLAGSGIMERSKRPSPSSASLASDPLKSWHGAQPTQPAQPTQLAQMAQQPAQPALTIALRPIEPLAIPALPSSDGSPQAPSVADAAKSE